MEYAWVEYVFVRAEKTLGEEELEEEQVLIGLRVGGVDGFGHFVPRSDLAIGRGKGDSDILSLLTSPLLL